MLNDMSWQRNDAYENTVRSVDELLCLRSRLRRPRRVTMTLRVEILIISVPLPVMFAGHLAFVYRYHESPAQKNSEGCHQQRSRVDDARAKGAAAALLLGLPRCCFCTLNHNDALCSFSRAILCVPLVRPWICLRGAPGGGAEQLCHRACGCRDSGRCLYDGNAAHWFGSSPTGER